MSECRKFGGWRSQCKLVRTNCWIFYQGKITFIFRDVKERYKAYIYIYIYIYVIYIDVYIYILYYIIIYYALYIYYVHIYYIYYILYILYIIYINAYNWCICTGIICLQHSVTPFPLSAGELNLLPSFQNGKELDRILISRGGLLGKRGWNF